MAMLTELDARRGEGKAAALVGRDRASNPYVSGDYAEAWALGWDSGAAVRRQHEYAEKVRRERAERRAAFEVKMQELIGTELFDEMTDWVKELIEEARR